MEKQWLPNPLIGVRFLGGVRRVGVTTDHVVRHDFPKCCRVGLKTQFDPPFGGGGGLRGSIGDS